MQLIQVKKDHDIAPHTCKAMVVSCIDFRLQKYLRKFEDEHIGDDGYDLMSFAGGTKDLKVLLEEVKISKSLHGICELYLINHEDCGAYGEEGSKLRHKKDLLKAKNKIEKLYPDLDIYTFYLHLDGEFEEVI